MMVRQAHHERNGTFLLLAVRLPLILRLSKDHPRIKYGAISEPV